MFSKLRHISLFISGTILLATALSACGSSETETSRTRNAAMAPTCAEGGQCVVGDTGPGGGVVFYTADSAQPWGQYLEAAPLKWAISLKRTPLSWQLKIDPDDPATNGDPITSLWNLVNSAFFPELSSDNLGVGTGRKPWEKTKNFFCGDCVSDVITEFNETSVLKDWYLPNKDELRVLIQSKEREMFASGYWSATLADRHPITGRMRAWGEGIASSTVAQYLTTNRMGVVPIRAFDARVVPEVATTTEVATNSDSTTSSSVEPSPEQSTTSSTMPTVVASSPATDGKLLSVTNLKVTFTDTDLVASFVVPNTGLKAEQIWLFLDWENGINGGAVLFKNNEVIIPLSDLERFAGKTNQMLVQSLLIVNSKVLMESSDVVMVTFPERATELTVPPSMVDDTSADVVDSIANLNRPSINLPETEIAIEIDPVEIIKEIENQLPNVEVSKIEIKTTGATSNAADNTFVELSQTLPTPYAIPVDASEVTLRITGASGQVIEQTKLIVRVANSGAVIATPEVDPVDDNVTSSTAPDDDVDVPVESATDDSSGSNLIVWLIIAILALLMAAFGAIRIRKNKGL